MPWLFWPSVCVAIAIAMAVPICRHRWWIVACCFHTFLLKQAPSLCYGPSATVLWCRHHRLSCWHYCRWLIVVFKKILETPSLVELRKLLQHCRYCATMVMLLPLCHVALLALALWHCCCWLIVLFLQFLNPGTS